MGSAVHGEAAKHEKQNNILRYQISGRAVARRLPGRFWKMGYHIIDPHVIPDSNAWKDKAMKAI